jgi:hypothetical protein
MRKTTRKETPSQKRRRAFLNKVRKEPTLDSDLKYLKRRIQKLLK